MPCSLMAVIEPSDEGQILWLRPNPQFEVVARQRRTDYQCCECGHTR
jgi:hypothetical protein